MTSKKYIEYLVKGSINRLIDFKRLKSNKATITEEYL